MPRSIFFVMPIYMVIFIVLYNNMNFVAGVKISHLWKMLLIYFFVIVLCMRWRKFIVFSEVKTLFLVSLIYVFWPLMSAMEMGKPQDAFFFVGQRLFPVLFLAILCTANLSERQGDKILFHVCLFFLLAALLFLTGVLAPLHVYVGLHILDIEGVGGFVGIHQKAHNASLVFMLLSIIALISASESAGRTRAIFIGLTGILVFIMLKTYVRSGMLGFIVGIASYFMYYRITKLPSFVFMGLIGLSLLLTGVVNVPGLSERIMGENKYQDTVDMNSISSGRMVIWASSLQTFEEASLYGKLVGVGRDNVISANEMRMGSPLFPHSGYIDALVSFGLVGLVLYVYLFFALFKAMQIGVNSKYKHIGMVMVIGFAAYSLFQSTDFPIPFMIILLLVRLNMPNVQENNL